MSIAMKRVSRLIVHGSAICFSAVYFVTGLAAVLFMKGWSANSVALLITVFTWFPNAIFALKKLQLAALIQLLFCLPIFLLTLVSNTSPDWKGYARGITYCVVFAVCLLLLYSDRSHAKQQTNGL